MKRVVGRRRDPTGFKPLSVRNSAETSRKDKKPPFPDLNGRTQPQGKTRLNLLFQHKTPKTSRNDKKLHRLEASPTVKRVGESPTQGRLIPPFLSKLHKTVLNLNYLSRMSLFSEE